MIFIALLMILQFSYADNGVLKYIFGLGTYAKFIDGYYMQHIFFEPWNISYQRYFMHDKNISLKSLRSSLLIIMHDKNHKQLQVSEYYIRLKSPFKFVFAINPDVTFDIDYAAKKLDIANLEDNVIKASLRMRTYSYHDENYSYIMQYIMQSEYDTYDGALSISSALNNIIESSSSGTYDINFGVKATALQEKNNLLFSSSLRYAYGVFYAKGGIIFETQDNTLNNSNSDSIFTGSIESGLRFLNFHTSVTMKLKHSPKGFMYTNNITFKIVNFLIIDGFITSLAVVLNNKDVYFGINIGSV